MTHRNDPQKDLKNPVLGSQNRLGPPMSAAALLVQLAALGEHHRLRDLPGRYFGTGWATGASEHHQEPYEAS